MIKRGNDAHSRGGHAHKRKVMLITCSYMRKVVERFQDGVLSELVGGKVVETWCPSAFISWLSHLICDGGAPGRDTVEMR